MKRQIPRQTEKALALTVPTSPQNRLFVHNKTQIINDTLVC
jgi:hypothetical protein